MKHIIYFDLDGVLADFNFGVYEKTGAYIDIDESVFNKDVKAEVFSDPTFFMDLRVMPGAIEMVEYAKGYGEVKVLTATGYSSKESVAAQKHKWVKKHFGDLEVHTVEKSHEKANYAWPDVVLIDDRLEKSVMPFRDKGGIGIHHTDVLTTKKHLDKLFK